MGTALSIHYAHKISAFAGSTSGAPLTIYIDRDRKEPALGDEVTLFTDDHELSRRLADAINNAVAEHSAAQAKREAA